MKAVVAIDSFKGSMSSMEAGNAAREGILAVFPGADVVVRPLADGGEGTTDALVEGLGGEKIHVTVTGPLGRPVTAAYGILPDTNMAVMEMASAAGITLEKEKNPLRATTYGVGEMILDALRRGCRDFLVGIGGSATNDGGIGMLQALGFVFRDEYGAPVPGGAACLERIRSVDDSGVFPLIWKSRFRIACDVNNPLCGPRGATHVFGPQKGVTEELMDRIESGMANYATVSSRYLGRDLRETPGTGAAGGLGFAFYSYLNARLTPGIELILDAICLERELRDADIVLTGEGRLDFQTAMGKVPVGVAKLAKKYSKPVLAFAGGVTEEAVECNRNGIDAFFPILRSVITLEEAMNPEIAQKNMSAAVQQAFLLIKCCGNMAWLTR